MKINPMKNKKSRNEVYKTKDIFIASTLFAAEVRLVSTEWLNGECFFCFEDKGKSEDIAKKYFANDLKVSPRKLFNCFKDIKSILFNKR